MFALTILAITFSIDPALAIQLVIAIILPILVGLVTTRVTSSGTKALLLAALSLLSSVLNELLVAVLAGVDFDLGLTLLKFAGTFFIAVATHFGFWKPVGASEAVQETGVTSARARDSRGRFVADEDKEGHPPIG